MSEAKSILSVVLLSLQFCLGFWQIVKLTLLGAFVKGYLALWMSMLPFGLGSFLSPSYTRLKEFGSGESSALKEVRCVAIQAADQPTLSRKIAGEIPYQIKSSYLGEIIDLERREGNKMFKDGKMTYYITDEIWYSLLEMGRLASLQTVFLKGHKEYGISGVTGGVMDLSEVLDSLILENHNIKALENARKLLPINLSVSEEKILKALNLAGLFLQTKQHVHWLIPVLFSFTAAMLEFMTPLRVWLYATINVIFNGALHLICDRLPLNTRAVVFNSVQVFLVELDPFNEIEWKITRGNICAVIGGGAKCHYEHATLVQPETEPDRVRQGETPGYIQFDFGPTKVQLSFNPIEEKCRVDAFFRCGSSTIVVNCKSDEYKKLMAFISCMKKNRCCSMKRCSPNNSVYVRWPAESIIHYAKAGFPDVYELKLNNALIK